MYVGMWNQLIPPPLCSDQLLLCIPDTPFGVIALMCLLGIKSHDVRVKLCFAARVM